MKIEVAKVDLENALSVVFNTVSGSGSDLSAHFLFRHRGGTVEVLAYQNRTFSLAPVRCRVEGVDGESFTLEAWRLNKWLSGIGDVVVFLNDENGEIKVSGGRSTIRLRSLDPSKFPFWDGTLSGAENRGTVSAVRLASAIGYAARFVSSEDTTRPEIAQIEVIDGALWSSDRRAVSIVKVNDLPESSLRVAGKDLPAVVKFLSAKPTVDGDVTVFETDSAVFFVRPDGAHVGAARPAVAFPRLKVDEADSEVWIQIPAEDFKDAINVLSASSTKGNERISFRTSLSGTSLSGQSIILSMTSEAGGEDEYPIELSGSEGLEKFPEDGFTVDYGHLLGLISHFNLNSLDLEVFRKGKGGYVAFRRGVKNENSYFSVIVWRT
jgi:DNA polymerase III sliding clamp (beta) subunit (PCNA family)